MKRKTLKKQSFDLYHCSCSIIVDVSSNSVYLRHQEDRRGSLKSELVLLTLSHGVFSSACIVLRF